MSESDDYKRGWQRGWNDGFNAGKNHLQMPVYPVRGPIPTWEPINQVLTTCSKCSKVWTGAVGYYCPQSDCPIQPKAT
jgi:hypothetical protein